MNYTPEQIRFFKQFLMEKTNQVLAIRDSADGVISMAFMRAFTNDRTFVKNRIMGKYGELSNTLSARINAGLKQNERILVIGHWINSETAEMVDKLNRQSLEAGNGYKIVFVNSTPHPELYNKYTWCICDTEQAANASIILDILSTMVKSIPKKTLPHTALRLGYNPDSINCANELCLVASSISMNDTTSIAGKLGVQLAALVNAVNRYTIVELVQNIMLAIVKGQVFTNLTEVGNSNYSAFGYVLPKNFEDAYQDSLTGCNVIANSMDRVAVKCDFDDISTHFDKPVTTYLVVGVSGAATLPPATIWMDRHPDCDILAIWDPTHASTLTLRSRTLDIHKVVYKDSMARSGYGKSKTFVRVNFKPDAMVLSGQILGKTCGFTGEFINKDE